MPLFISLVERMSVVITLAFILSRSRTFRKLLQEQASSHQKLLLILVFGLLGIFGSYAGIPIQDALANSRVIAPMVGGLFGGPLVGFLAGLIAGGHRFFMGGFTALACGVSTTVEGLLGGLVARAYRRRPLPWPVAFAAGFVAEALQMLIILALARPFTAAWSLVKVIAWPMMLVNASGIALAVIIIQSVLREQELAGAVQAQKALKIANKTLPYLRQGLNADSARQAAAIIMEITGLEAVAITSGDEILAHVGAGSDHHRQGQKVLTNATRQALDTGKIQVAQTGAEIGCHHQDCPLRAAVVVPLESRGKVIGTLKLYHTRANAVGPLDLELAAGLGHLFSTQLELAEIDRQEQLVAKAEIRALQSQINPHFLFNALNTIMSVCRLDPEKARQLLGYLGDFFRRNLQHPERPVTLATEIEYVRSYLAIEKARFGSRLEVTIDVEPGVAHYLLPALTLQPLVENAVKHGLLPRREGGQVTITAREVNGEARITVSDNGVGIDLNKVTGLLAGNQANSNNVGLLNVHERLRLLYGPEYGLRFSLNPGGGTRVEFSLPRQSQAAFKEGVAS
ncbi:sensor histidine kinase [Neomoorella mulderi]|uniref:histidine kinase n=1 Tax=Moorella mulderi DSM 14980 TaxID=1122241 RepID=A0A151B126_9FIRM|nr:sensor histidine kinase [Moorella mulderi]KYH33520.1 sensor histidine kinase YpdA [Moorella mulderi DSM 14980]